MINFNKAFETSKKIYNTERVLVDDLCMFVNREVSLNSLRSYWSGVNPEPDRNHALHLVYSLERRGVNKARELARRALNRRGYKVRTNG